MAASKKPLRNWAAIDPLMRKGGAHQVAKQALRPRLDWRAALDDYIDWQADIPADTVSNVTDKNAEGPQGPSSFLATACRLRVSLWGAGKQHASWFVGECQSAVLDSR